MAKYQIKSQEEGKTMIEKSDFTSEFRLEDVKAYIEKLKRTKQELEAQVSLEQAKIDNVKEYHAEIFDLPEEKKTAIVIVEKAKELKETCEKKLEEIEFAFKQYREDLAEVKKQTGLSIDLEF